MFFPNFAPKSMYVPKKYFPYSFLFCTRNMYIERDRYLLQVVVRVESSYLKAKKAHNYKNLLYAKLGVTTFEKMSSNLAEWWIFEMIFHEDFKNVNFINVGHILLTGAAHVPAQLQATWA